MKAAVLLGKESIELKEVSDPEVSEGGALIEIETCAICGTDVKMFKYGYSSSRLPLIPGHELGGTIARIGSNRNDFKKGDRITLNPNIPCGTCYYCQRGLQTACDNLEIVGVHRDGGFSEYVAIPAQAVEQGCMFKIPENISFEEAALIDPASCAVNACELSRVGPESVVAVIGAGPAGCLNVEVSKAYGAKKVILIQRSHKRLKQAEFTQADVFINSSEEDPVSRVLEETGGQGADVVVVACASGEAQQQAIQMVAKRGNVNLFGGLPKGSPAIQFESNIVHYKEAFVIGTHGGSNRHCKIALDMISQGKIKAKEYISNRITLSDFHTALDLAIAKQGLKIFVVPK